MTESKWRVKKGAPVPWSYYNNGGVQRNGPLSPTLWTQETRSSGHAFRLLGKYPGDIGGDFHTGKYSVEVDNKDYVLSRKVFDSVVESYRGPIWPSIEVHDIVNSGIKDNPVAARTYYDSIFAFASNQSIDSKGATAISKCLPTNPIVDLSVSLAELMREGLPKLIGQQGNIGSEYLNIQFGVLPLVSDGQDLYKAATQSAALLKQYERDSGRRVRRGYRFEDEVSSNVRVTANSPPFTPQYSATGNTVGNGTLTAVETKNTSTWFSGAFVYHLPRQGSVARRIAELDYLYGIKPGADTAWNLLPWSWLADYFANMGDVIHNVNAFKADGLVMPYGYVMQTVERTVEYTLQHSVRGANGLMVPNTAMARVKTLTKQRRRANPFGFGIDLNSLTGRQVSILAALGISRK